MNLLDGINDTEDELYTFDSIMETKDEDAGLDALNKLREYWLNHLPLSVNGGLRIVKVLEKEHKALKILKDICNLKVCKNKLGQCFIEGTDILFPISQETYNLLKEVL